MGLFKFIFELNDSIKKREKESKRKYLEKQMKEYELDEHEKELVRKGLWDSCDFAEDDDMTESDYYYDK